MDLNEREWAKALANRLSAELAGTAQPHSIITVEDGRKLPYTCQIYEYSSDDIPTPEVSKYETDILICDTRKDGFWVPRVVIESKLAITTHDALTYSAKAATHKHVHPYLWYGILVGGQRNQALPGRLIKPGADFDFMLSWKNQVPTDGEWRHFFEILGQEVESSRTLEDVLTTSRSPSHRRYQSLHRKLILELAETDIKT